MNALSITPFWIRLVSSQQPVLVITLLALLASSLIAIPATAKTPTKNLSIQTAKVVAVAEHKPNWFTQGLYKDGDTFYISSGLYGQSALIVQSKKNTQTRQLNRRYFAEGLTVIGDTLYLLTWQEKTLLAFNKQTLQPTGKMHYQGEGWGLTHIPSSQGKAAEFIMSNGSDTLLFRDSKNFNITRQLKIEGLNFINELEYIDGLIWANRWYDNHLYAIDSNSGCIVAKVDLLPLRKQAVKIDRKNVVNGVAYDKEKNGLWVTGKYWSKRFLIKMPSIDNDNC